MREWIRFASLKLWNFSWQNFERVLHEFQKRIETGRTTRHQRTEVFIDVPEVCRNVRESVKGAIVKRIRKKLPAVDF